LSAENSDAMSVGMMAQGLSWVRKQRESRQRLYLQNQAEQQLRKLQQAQQQEKEELTERSLVDNPTFRNIIKGTPKKEPAENEKDSGDFAMSKSGDGYSFALPLHYSKDDAELDASFIPAVRVEPDEDDDDGNNPVLMTPAQMHQIASHVLPRGIAYCRWKRLYSLARDGDAFNACLQCIQDHKQTLLVVRTSRDAVFGGFTDAAWEPHQHGGAQYFGGSSACLFRIDSRTNKVKYYKWTGANHYVQLCDVNNKMLALGGGGGAFGLCLQEDFQLGSTGSCATFDNEPLCDEENFKVRDVEVFGFLVGQF
jgi:hypothetical protein